MTTERESATFINALPKHYAARDVEAQWMKRWEQEKVFHSEPDAARRPYTIVIPPPNVTGILHMGHALNLTLQDILIRFQRMRGRNALWVPGTDHAGIATQNVVERHLKTEGVTRDDLGREKFIDRVWEWKEQYHKSIVAQIKKVGSSCDWERERFTMDEGLSRAVRKVFTQLYKEGLIYRGLRLVNWCVRCQTALSDDEAKPEDMPGKLWHIRYAVKDRRRQLVVATTRPETMLGDTALAVHPDDERYQDLIGQTAILPIVGREIPIIADEFVDPRFGTGIVKITPAHDPNDYECGNRHNLAQIVVIGADGNMTEAAGKFAGLDRFRCREILVTELADEKYLEKVEDHAHAVPKCYRCQTIVEPHLSEQWFVRMRPLADKAAAASQEKRVRFHPARWERVYLSWLENVRDWCISRQIWWGHRIPVWYCQGCGETIVPDAEPQVDPTACTKCASEKLKQDDDVLDTWFSSALWPFSTLGWPEKTDALKYYYPTSTLITDRGIIYFWVARMVMLGLHFNAEVPFRDVYIHGTILDENGAKMSKSMGNGIDPIVMIDGGKQERFGKEFESESYGADAVRYTLCSLTTEGQDIKLAPTRFEMGRNFINKVWNVSRFVMMNLSSIDESTYPVGESVLRFEDRWILSRLSVVVVAGTAALEGFKYSDYARVVYDFTWRDFCDWYVEMVKERMRAGGPDAQVAGRVLAWTLDQMLRLLHPLAPFFTEEVWSLLGRVAPLRGLGHNPPVAAPLIATVAWPDAGEERRVESVEKTMKQVQDVVRAIRNIRSKFNIPPRATVSAVVNVPDDDLRRTLREQNGLIQSQATAESVTIGVGQPKPEQSAAEVMDGMQVFVPLSGLMDVAVEQKRVQKELNNKGKALKGIHAKLNNQEFLTRAPAEIVTREENRKTEIQQQIVDLKELAASLAAGG